MSFDLQYDMGVQIPDILQSEHVRVELLGQRIRLSLRVKADDRTVIAKALGLTLPSKINSSNVKVELMTACLGPDEWIVIGDLDKHKSLYSKALKLSEKYVMSVTDVSFRNVAVELTGIGAADMINVGCPLDLSLQAFQIGKCTRTVYESAPVFLYRSGEYSFTLECWRSFAPYMIGLMAAYVGGG